MTDEREDYADDDRPPFQLPWYVLYIMFGVAFFASIFVFLDLTGW
jgi:hypothetical protein